MITKKTKVKYNIVYYFIILNILVLWKKPKFRIGFDINGVLRNTIGKIEQTYDNFIYQTLMGLKMKVSLIMK